MCSSYKSSRGGRKIRKIICLILCLAILVNFSSNSYAMITNTPKLVKIGEITKHLKYFREDRGYSTYVVCSIVGFYENNIFYPAYCMNKNLPGAEAGEYEVNIKNILNNSAVWRVISNGYPYKKCNQLGLENDFDAYAVTKFAVYCVLGESKIEYYSADENDSYGQKLLQVLKELVDFGMNGTDLPNSNIVIDKVSDVKENDKYFYMDCKIKSNIEMSSYSITKLNGFPEETIYTDLNNINKDVFLNNEIIRIQIPKEKFYKDIYGEISCLAKCKTYPIFYGEAPSGKQNYVVTYDGIEDVEVKGFIEIKTNTGNITVLKKDKDSLKGIANVKFELYNEFYKYEAQTNEKGEVNFKNLYPGKYKLKEIYTSDEYKMLEEELNIEISYNEVKEIEILNELKKGNFKIVKQGDDGSKLSKVEFKLYDENMNLLETLITDENGEAFSNVYPSKNKRYFLKETKNADGYILNEDVIELKLEDEACIQVFVENKKEEIPDIPQEDECYEEIKLPKTGY